MNVDGTVQQARVGVVVHRAESLVGLSASGTSNPFVSVSVGATVLSTPVVQNSTNPTFEAAFNFPECPIPTILTLRVFHKEAGGVESPLGSATLTLFSPSAMTRRQVQLGHGGSVVLSQKARDGCGSLDISYEVVAPTSYKATASEQRKSVDDDLPSFLRDDAGAETLTSAFTAFSQPPPPPAAAIPKPPEFGAVPPPPPAAAIPKPPEFGAVPPPPAAAIPKPPEFGAVPPPPPAASIPKPPEFGAVAPPPPAAAIPKPPEFGAVPPPPPAAAIPKPPEFGAVPPPPPPAAAIPKPPEFGAVAPPPPAAAIPKPPEFGAVPPPPPAAAIPKPPEFGAVPPPPPAAAIPKPPEFGAVPPPPPAAAIPKPPEFGAVPPPPPAAAIPKPPEFGAVPPPVPVVVPSTSGQSFIASAAFANEDSSETSPPPSSSTMPDTGGTSHSSHRGYSSASSPNSTNHTQLQRQQMASASSTGATSTSLHTSSNHSSTAPPPPLQAQKEPPLHGVDETSRAPSGSASVEPTAKDSDKSQKKVRIATNAKDCPTSAGTAANTKPPLRQPSESGRGRSCSSVSPTREARRTSSAQGGRSSPYVHGPVVKKVNNFTAQGTTLLSAARRSANFQVPTIYQYPEELLAAASQGDVAVFQRLREEDPQLSRGFEKVRDYSGRTILHIAAWYGHVQVLKILLQPTPVAPLLELRALRSVNGNTILHSAAQGGRVDAVQWLRFSTAAASLIGQRNARGITATECAREAGFSNVALMLAETM
ncbi:C2 domain/Ankyrin repeats (3 copies) [Trypanosoma brucei equiperdum]|uniref:C2 domain/Ankyrin repeats (3 copies) n=1 Tax=Trypanosoma brucei equiperdum TaxID=630700 RepID=A0A3L6L4T6_9TRYP|nr:C2 domain/Ankyrin repeats (3 copies) [Trypanosoma brucei equiperdum]